MTDARLAINQARQRPSIESVSRIFLKSLSHHMFPEMFLSNWEKRLLEGFRLVMSCWMTPRCRANISLSMWHGDRSC